MDDIIDNVVAPKFGAIQGGKPAEDDVPQHLYEILDHDGMLHSAHGFLIFTPQHVAIMRNLDQGALPVLIFPLEHVKYAKISEQQELPF